MRKIFLFLLIIYFSINIFSKAVYITIINDTLYWKRVKIIYKGRLAKKYNIYLHYGVNNWNFIKTKKMELFYTKNGQIGYKTEILIDKFINKIDFCFFGKNFNTKKVWDNNNNKNWHYTLKKDRYIKQFIIIKNNKLYLRIYTISNEKNIFIHYGINNWKNIKNAKMNKNKNIYFYDIELSKKIKEINYCFYTIRNTKKIWDNNYKNNWNFKFMEF